MKKIGWAMSILPSLMFVMGGVMNLLKPAEVVEGARQMGYPVEAMTGIGIALMLCTLFYLLPRTAVLGAVLLTGYLGGAVATHVRVGDPPLNTLMPVIFGAVVWGGLWMRDERIRNLLPLVEKGK